MVVLTWYWRFELLRIGGNQAPLELVASNSRRPYQDQGPVDARPGVQLGHLLVGGDLFAIEVVILCGVIDYLFSFGFGGTAGGFRGLAAG